MTDTPAAAAASSATHPVGYHRWLPAQLPEFRERLLGWYDQHRRKLPWRGDAPAAIDASAAASSSGATAAAASSANSAFGAREKKAAKAKQQQKVSEAQSVARFFVKQPKAKSAPASGNDAAAASSDTKMDFESSAASSAAAAATAVASPSTAASSSSASAATPLPVSAYGTWVSEIMLQQTRVETVIDYYTRWMSRFPTVAVLAAASPDDVQRFWSGLGYYRRARFLHEGAQQLVRDFSGELPGTIEGLKQIKGIGPYTAGAIGSIALKLPVPLVDGNVTRVLCRLRALALDPKAKATDALMWLLAEELLDRARPGDFNQALMELGAVVCTPLSPRCAECPVAALCYARREVDEKRRPCNIQNEERQAAPTAAALKNNEPMDIEDLGAASPSSPAAAAASSTDAVSSAPASAAKSKKPSRAKSTSSSASAAAIFAAPLAPCTLCTPLDGAASSGGVPSAVTAYPLKASKPAPLEQSVAVCVVKRAGGAPMDDLYLILRRPNVGLLANQWELPSAIVAVDASAAQRAAAIASLLSTQLCLPTALLASLLQHDPAAAPLGELTHLFSHRKHLMRITEATLDLDSADESVSALLQAASADRIVDSPASSVPAAAAASSASKKRNASSSASKSKRRKADEAKSKASAADDADTEDEDAEGEADDAEADSSALRSYRWVPLSLLQQPHTLQSGSELGLTSAVRKIVKLIGEGGKQSKSKSKPASASTKSKPTKSAAASSSAAAAAPASSSAAADRCVIELDSDEE